MNRKDRRVLRRVCAWCSPPRPVDGQGAIRAGEAVTHGICEGCFDQEIKQALLERDVVHWCIRREEAPQRDMSSDRLVLEIQTLDELTPAPRRRAAVP